MAQVEQEFLHRASRIQHHGLGLSVDVYSPNLLELVEALSCRDLSCGYLEIFQAPEQALKAIRAHLPQTTMECHAEGLWVTQPNVWEAYPIQASVRDTATQLHVLGCSWFNQECASKQMAGYSFGTYLPPLFSRLSAEVTAANASRLQIEMDAMCADTPVFPPLLLLETPPLTYFALGNLSYPEFFSVLTDIAPCGLVLDIGHVWTVYRYTGGWRRQTALEYLAEFLDAFPLSRVIQIHAAGLAVSADGSNHHRNNEFSPPDWIDAHGEPIPEVLFDMLDLVLAHPGLTNLKGVALEVDTKTISLIIEEYRRFATRYSWWQGVEAAMPNDTVSSGLPLMQPAISQSLRETLLAGYQSYVHLVSGRESLYTLTLEYLGDGAVDQYRKTSLSREILEWGGDLHQMFPRTIRQLEARGVSISTFVDFWFARPRPNDEPFDFFLMKIQRFMEFVEVSAPDVLELANQEAMEMRAGYELANIV